MASKKSGRKPKKLRAPKPDETPSQPTLNEELLGFGRNVRALRRACGMSVERLAEEAGLSPNHVAAIERGEKNPKFSTFWALVTALEVKADVLLDGPFRGKEGLSVPSRAFRDLFNRAPEDFRAHVRRRLEEKTAKPRKKK